MKLEQIEISLNVQVSASLRHVGEYNSEIDIDVSTYKPTSVSQFICVMDDSAEIEAKTSGTGTSGSYGMSWAHVKAKYTPPSLSLNGYTLHITPGKVTAFGSAIGCSVKTTDKLLWTDVYFLG